MNLKNNISLIVSLLFTIIYAISATVIYALFADFRKEEFEIRLKDKAISSIKLLVEVEQIDRQLLKIIDQNRINKLYDEKTLIFDANYKLIYSSLDDTKIKWKVSDLQYLKENKTFFRKDNQNEVYGFFYDTHHEDYYALISAVDTFGKRKLDYLLYILIGTYIAFTIICWFITLYVVKKLLTPLDVFHHKLKGINENNLDTRIAVKEKKDEIDLLADEFNQMLKRIDNSYQKQKEFTSHASHELRTPIARLTSQLENKILEKQVDTDTKSFLTKLLVDISQISELINSLLLLSKIESLNTEFEVCRIDEIIYEVSDNINKNYPDFKLQLEIDDSNLSDSFLEIKGSKSLLKIAFSNLLKNAYIYSDNKLATVLISTINNQLVLSISNTGKTLQENEISNLFQPFMRGSNSKNSTGLGLGLRMVQRIIFQHKGFISYNPANNLNTFIITFKL